MILNGNEKKKLNKNKGKQLNYIVNGDPYQQQKILDNYHNFQSERHNNGNIIIIIMKIMMMIMIIMIIIIRREVMMIDRSLKIFYLDNIINFKFFIYEKKGY